MKTCKYTMRVCLINKRILLNRKTIMALGNPSHLSFWYGEDDDRLIFAPAANDDLDTYEIPQHYWRDKERSCEISRIAFLKTLQYINKWEDGSKHLFEGVLTEVNGVPAIVFHMNESVRLTPAEKVAENSRMPGEDTSFEMSGHLPALAQC